MGWPLPRRILFWDHDYTDRRLDGYLRDPGNRPRSVMVESKHGEPDATRIGHAI